MRTGANRTGTFRAIMPTTPTPMLPSSVEFRCEISRGSAFINLTTRLGAECMTFSMRPPESRPEWILIGRRPPVVLYLAPEMVALPPRNVPVAPDQINVVATGNNQVTAPGGKKPPINIDNPITIMDAPPAPSGWGDSKERPAVEIIDEISGHGLIDKPFIGAAPLPAPPIAHDRTNQVVGNRKS